MDEIRITARDYYCKQNFSIDTIARLLDNKVSKRTLFNWKKEEDWDTMKRRYLSRPKSLEDALWDLAFTYAEKAKESPDPQLAYALSSIITGISNNQKINAVAKAEENPEAEKSKGLSPETLKKILDLMGIE